MLNEIFLMLELKNIDVASSNSSNLFYLHRIVLIKDKVISMIHSLAVIIIAYLYYDHSTLASSFVFSRVSFTRLTYSQITLMSLP